MGSLISLDALGEVANNLINKLSSATGWVVTHSTPKREAISTYIKGIQESDLDPLTKAVLISNAKKTIEEYSNQCSVVQNAVNSLKPTAKPEKVDTDWINQFMDKARLVSDADFQLIWGRILAEECNNPNSMPKGLLFALEKMDKKDATDFSAVCSVSVEFSSDERVTYSPIIRLRKYEDFYKNAGITYERIVDLQSIGLVQTEVGLSDDLYIIDSSKASGILRYHDQTYVIPEDKDFFYVGSVIFTRIGEALCKAVTPVKHDDFFEDYCIPHLWN